MTIIQQTPPANISVEDWNYYLSKSPIKLISMIAKGLKEDNRYFVDDRFNKLLFTYLFDPQSRYYAQRDLINVKMFRARIYKETDLEERLNHPEKFGAFKGYDSKGSGIVEPEKASPGRGNPEGISYLYCASDIQTALLEVRAQPGETVSVATIYLKEEAILFDLTNSVSGIEAETEDKTKWIQGFALGLESFFQKPYSIIGGYYLCQYISEYAKIWGLDGMMYRASHVQESGTNSGINFIIFNPSKCKVLASKLYYIERMYIETTPQI